MRERFRLLALTGTFGFGVAIGVIWWPGPMFLFMVAGYIAAQFFPMPTPARLGVSMAPALAGAVALTSHGSVVLVLGTLGTALPLSRLLVHLLHGRRVGDERFPSEPVGIGVFGGLFAVAALVIDGQAAADATTLTAYAIAAGGGYVASSAMRSISSGRSWASAATLLLSGTFRLAGARRSVFGGGALCSHRTGDGSVVAAPRRSAVCVRIHLAPSVAGDAAHPRPDDPHWDGSRRRAEWFLSGMPDEPPNSRSRWEEISVLEGGRSTVSSMPPCSTTSAVSSWQTRRSPRGITPRRTCRVGAPPSSVRPSTLLRSPISWQ